LIGKEGEIQGVIKLIHTLRPFFRGEEWRVVIALVLSVAQPLGIIPLPLLIHHAFDVAIPHKDFSQLLVSGAGFMVLSGLSILAALSARRLVLKSVKQAVADLRIELMERLYSLPSLHFKKIGTGTMHTAIVQGTERTDIMITTAISVLLPAVIAITGIGILLITINFRLFLITMGLLFFSWILTRMMGKKMRQTVQQFHKSFEGFSSSVLQSIRSFDLAIISGTVNRELDQHQEKVSALRDDSNDLAMRISVHQQINWLLMSVTSTVILVVGGMMVVNADISIGQFFAFFAGIGLLRPFINGFTNNGHTVIYGLDSMQTLYKLFEQFDFGRNSKGKRIKISGRVELQNVAFAYDNLLVLKDVSLHLRPGFVTGLTGAVGSGKTTLASILLGHLELKSGKVLYDDEDLTKLDNLAMRQQIGVVPQHPFLIPGTVRENILYGASDEHLDNFEEATALAGFETLLGELSQGFETEVGEDGRFLSGGQRQSIAVARSLIRCPKLIVLDEPGNHLSRDVLKAMISSLKRVSWQPAILFISHDPALAELADFRYHMKNKTIQRVHGENNK
jgi:ATP-binding cassette subfamily B protein